MAAGAAVVGIISAIVAAVGAGISSGSATDSSEKKAKLDREARAAELKKQREQDKFQFGFSQLVGQRARAQDRAKKSIFNQQVMQTIGGNRGRPNIGPAISTTGGAPGVSTF